MKKINGYDDYLINESGEIFSLKYSECRKMKTWHQKHGGYENVKLSKNGKTKNFRVHRLVAEAFCENLCDYKEVNHIDNNPKNNHAKNLEWCSRKHNLKQSYSTMPATRNFVEVELYAPNGSFVGEFKAISQAATFASENFGASRSGIIRNRKSKGYYLKCRD